MMGQIQNIAALKQEHESARQKVIEASKAVFELSSKIDNLTKETMKEIPTVAYFPLGRPKIGFPVRVVSETPPPENSTFSKSVLMLEFMDTPEKGENFFKWYQEWVQNMNGAMFNVVMSNGDVYIQCSPLGMVSLGNKVTVEISYDKIQ